MDGESTLTAGLEGTSILQDNQDAGGAGTELSLEAQEFEQDYLGYLTRTGWIKEEPPADDTPPDPDPQSESILEVDAPPADGEPSEDPAPGSDDALELGEDALIKVRAHDGQPETQITGKELIEGYMRQDHFTRSQQALAEQKRQFETEMTAFHESSQEMAKRMEELELVAERITKDPLGSALLLQQVAQAQGINEPMSQQSWEVIQRQHDLEKQQNALQQQQQQWDNQQKSQRQTALRQDVEEQFARMEAQYKAEGFDRAEVARHMVQNRITDMDVAWNAIRAPKLAAQMEEVKQQAAQATRVAEEARLAAEKAKAEGVRELIEQKSKEVAQPPTLGAGGSGSTTPGMLKPPDSFKDAKKMALDLWEKEGWNN